MIFTDAVNMWEVELGGDNLIASWQYSPVRKQLWFSYAAVETESSSFSLSSLQ